MSYWVANHFGSSVVSDAEALAVWERWAPERRSAEPTGAFLVWDNHENGCGRLMSTAYIPVPAEEHPQGQATATPRDAGDSAPRPPPAARY